MQEGLFFCANPALARRGKKNKAELPQDEPVSEIGYFASLFAAESALSIAQRILRF